MSKNSNNKIHDTLLSLAKSSNKVDLEKLKNFIEKNKGAIEKIVNECGTGNNILMDAYDVAYETRNYEFAEYYQQLLEQIHPSALFENE